MKVARVAVSELATPIAALVCDEALYEPSALGVMGPHDFFERVVASRCAGFEAAAARLASGVRPSAARIPEGAYLPLAPFDTERSAYVQLGAPNASDAEPAFRIGDARSVVGDGHPVPVHGAEPRARVFAEVGVAVVMGEDLESATSVEAGRSVVGWTLAIQWTNPSAGSSDGGVPSAQMGPCLVVAPSLRAVRDRSLVIDVEGARVETRPFDAHSFSIAESLAFVSQRVALRAGDVVGLGAVGKVEVALGTVVRASLPGMVTLVGRAARATPGFAWRERPRNVR